MGKVRVNKFKSRQLYVDKSFVFDSTDDCIVFKNKQLIDFGLNSDFSINILFKPNSLIQVGTEDQRIFSNSNGIGGGNGGYEVFISSNRFSFQIDGGGGECRVEALGDLIVGEWHFFTVTIQKGLLNTATPSDAVSIYRKGVLQDLSIISNTQLASFTYPDNITVGSISQPDNDGRFDGEIALLNICSKKISANSTYLHFLQTGALPSTDLERCVFYINASKPFEADTAFATKHNLVAGDYVMEEKAHRFNIQKQFGTVVISSFSDNGSGGTTVTLSESHNLQDSDGANIYNGTYQGRHFIFNTTATTFDIPIAFSVNETDSRWDTSIPKANHGKIFGKTASELGIDSNLGLNDFYHGFLSDRVKTKFADTFVLSRPALSALDNLTEFSLHTRIDFNIASNNVSKDRFIFYQDGTSGNQIRLDIAISPLKGFEVFINGTVANVAFDYDVFDGQTKLITLDYKSSTVFIYADGVLVGSNSAQPSLGTSGTNLGIGNIVSGSLPFKDYIEYTAICTTATTERIMFDLANDVITIDQLPNLLEGWKFNEPSGRSYTSVSGINGNDLTPQGTYDNLDKWASSLSRLPLFTKSYQSNGTVNIRSTGMAAFGNSEYISVMFTVLSSSDKLSNNELILQLHDGTNSVLEIGQYSGIGRLNLDVSISNVNTDPRYSLAYGGIDFEKPLNFNVYNTFILNFKNNGSDEYLLDQLFVNGIESTFESDTVAIPTATPILLGNVTGIGLGNDIVGGNIFLSDIIQAGVFKKRFSKDEAEKISFLGLPSKGKIKNAHCHYLLQNAFEDGTNVLIRDYSSNGRDLNVLALTGGDSATQLNDYLSNFLNDINQNK